MNFHEKQEFIKKNKEIEAAAEKQMIYDFADVVSWSVVKTQSDNEKDDGGTDGILLANGVHEGAEARRKGYPNHLGETCYAFNKGWGSHVLTKGGVWINEIVLTRYIGDNSTFKRFVYLVDILCPDGRADRRAALISQDRIKELLRQPYLEVRSTNTKRFQSVKGVPVEWFKKKF